MPTPATPAGKRLTLLLLAVSLTACATYSLPPVQPAVPKPPPELMQPPEPGTWSEFVRGLLQKWRVLLTPANPG